MVRVTQSVYVSLAYRPAGGKVLGGNWRLDLAIDVEPGDAYELRSHLDFLKDLLDHRCLWDDLDEFKSTDSSAENVCRYLGPLVFSRTLQAGRWASLSLVENETNSFTLTADGKFSSSFKIMNLLLECSGPLDRPRLTQVVMGLHRENFQGADEAVWSEAIWTRLKSDVQSLRALRIDLGRRGYIVWE